MLSNALFKKSNAIYARNTINSISQSTKKTNENCVLKTEKTSKDLPKNRVVIACISGYQSSGDGSDTGMHDLSVKIRNELAPIGIPGNNIFWTTWTEGNQHDPSNDPDPCSVAQKIIKQNKCPLYIAIIGHSYGAWTAVKTSGMMTNNGFKPGFLGLIDPVFGPENKYQNSYGLSAVKSINWYQINGLGECYNACSDNKNPRLPIDYLPTSTGNQDVPTTEKYQVDHKCDVGPHNRPEPQHKKCWPLKPERIKAWHVNIDDDPYTHFQIISQIKDDLKKLGIK